jgi:hypothetical protein
LSEQTDKTGDATPSSEPPPAAATPSGEGAETSAAPTDGAPKKKRRRRRKKKKGPPGPDAPATAARASGTEDSASSSAGATADASASLAALAGGLLSHIDDREVPCSVDGCDNYWVWPAAEQIQAFGKPPPRRMCDECRAIEDRAVRCSVEGCRRTWNWTRDAQLKHRAWLRRQGHDSAGKGRGKKRRRRGRNDGTPRRMCDLCQAKLGRLVEKETVCKVHGCTRTVKVERELQLRAWAALRTDDLDAEAPLAKKMCDVCRDFCRMHPDREVACGRPGCDRTWTYKTGAQLQAFLAGRLEDPIRLCDTCQKGGFADPGLAAGIGGRVMPAADGSEIMPCVVLGCGGTWIYRPGMNLAPAMSGGALPVDRMCDEHRQERGAAPRAEPAPVEPERKTIEPPASEPAAELEPADIGMNPEGSTPAAAKSDDTSTTDRSNDPIVVESVAESVEAPPSE